jgi:hypothetical protein
MSATYSSFTVIGQREDLSDVIYDISPQDTPIMSSIEVESYCCVP